MRAAAPAVIIVIALLAPGIAFGQASSDAKQPTITMPECRELISAMLKADGWTTQPGFSIAFDDIPDYPEFCFIDATHNTGGGSRAVHFAVERTTGDVWSAPVCGRYSSPTIAKLQQALRTRVGLTNAEYERIRKPGPGCRLGQVPEVLKMGTPTIADIYTDSGGSVHIVYGDGSEFQPPKEKEQASCSSPAVAESKSAAGWAVEKVVCCQPYPIPTTIVVYRLDKQILQFETGQLIVAWRFLDNGAHVVSHSDRSHGVSSPHYALWDVNTGREIDNWDGELTELAPAWARSIL